jgi:hypothetical protein
MKLCAFHSVTVITQKSCETTELSTGASTWWRKVLPHAHTASHQERIQLVNAMTSVLITWNKRLQPTALCLIPGHSNCHITITMTSILIPTSIRCAESQNYVQAILNEYVLPLAWVHKKPSHIKTIWHTHPLVPYLTQPITIPYTYRVQLCSHIKQRNGGSRNVNISGFS